MELKSADQEEEMKQKQEQLKWNRLKQETFFLRKLPEFIHKTIEKALAYKWSGRLLLIRMWEMKTKTYTNTCKLYKKKKNSTKKHKKVEYKSNGFCSHVKKKK